MIHLIWPANRHLYTGELRANHRERHRQFVVEAADLQRRGQVPLKAPVVER